MDSITHIALGACMGEAFAGKKLGKKAMLWGALAQSAPDIDFISSFWMNTPDGLLAHRGFTHSFLFCLLLTPLMAFAAEKWHRPHNIKLSKWLLFFGGVIFIHIFIDAFNNYGTGWFEPFSHTRISFNAIYVADPFFSTWTIISFIVLLVMKRNNKDRKLWWRFGLGLSATYLVYCLVNKRTIDKDVKEILHDKNISYTQYLSTPAPLQNWLWYIVAGNDSGYYIGYRSAFDYKKDMDIHYFPRNEYLLEALKSKEDLHKLIRFSQNFYTVQKQNDTLIFNDLRFGQVVGWYDRNEEFVFHYYLNQEDNALVVQRGRFAKWNKKSFDALLSRIRGEQPASK